MKENGESMNFIYLFIKGIIIGFFMLVPGISGGSIAILMDVYDDLLINLNSIFTNFKRSSIFLFVALLGGLVGVFLSSFVLSFIVEIFYFEMIYIFIGLMIAYFISIMKKSRKNNIIRNIMLVISGVLIGLLITMIPIDLINIGNKYLKLLLVGIFLAIALILPGISVSYVLLIFSMYDQILIALRTLDFRFLIEIGIALLIGMILVIKLLNHLMINYKDILENIIIGFIFSSIWLILPPISSTKEALLAIILILLGIIFRIISTIKKT